MKTISSIENLEVGAEVAQKEFLFTRDSLVKYAGASLDFNPIHYRDDFAQSVGLPGVLAHGMLTMGAAATTVTDVLGEGVFVADYQVRFTRPVPVAADTGAKVYVTATVAKIDPELKTARIDLNVKFDDKAVLGRAQLVLQF